MLNIINVQIIVNLFNLHFLKQYLNVNYNLKTIKNVCIKKGNTQLCVFYKTLMKAWPSFNVSFKYFKVVPLSNKKPHNKMGKLSKIEFEKFPSVHWKHIDLSLNWMVCKVHTLSFTCDRKYLLETIIVNSYLPFVPLSIVTRITLHIHFFKKSSNHIPRHYQFNK